MAFIDKRSHCFQMINNILCYEKKTHGAGNTLIIETKGEVENEET